MGTIWRSEDMSLVQVFIQLEAAHETVDELGKVGMVQFRDLNEDINVFQRNFATEVRKADDLERQLRFFESQVEAEEGLEDEMEAVVIDSEEETTTAFHLDELAGRFDELETELVNLNNNQEILNRNYNELVEFKHVLRKESAFFAESAVQATQSAAPMNEHTSLMAEGEQDFAAAEAGAYSNAEGLGFISGVVVKDKLQSFERVLWRVVRGNLYMKTAPIDTPVIDPATGEQLEKLVFIVFFQGERSKQKIRKICESFGANLYPCSDNAQTRADLLVQVEARLQDLADVLVRSHAHRHSVLLTIGNHLEAWVRMVTKEKAIYHTMNMFNYDVGRRCLIAEGWAPTQSLEEVQEALDRASSRSGARVVMHQTVTREKPPTYFRLNKYTAAFQGIVDSYGIARYKEVNPGVFTIVTFPFLFGIMFGDVGHGTIMTLVAIAFIFYEKSLGATKLNEMIAMLFNARYLLLLMGLFSIYCGALYNEYFSVPMDFFGTRWEAHSQVEDFLHWNCKYRTAYPFGVDPAWKGAANEINFYNTLKMKLSVIVGVTHMVGGLILGIFNHVHFRQPINIIFEWIPQMIFFISLFGYMDFLIIYKWCVHWANPSDAPHLINVMINIFLKPKVEFPNNVYNAHIQMYVQLAIILLVVVSVPWMLIPKPIALWLMSKRKKDFQELNGSSSHEDSDSPFSEEASEEVAAHGGHDDEEFDMGEVFVHQIIHTIEFVLSGVSHTASYLRLWALSLAHSELATVFWDRIMVLGMTTDLGQAKYVQFILIFVTVTMWAGATVLVLLIMESLSAFLHALRLHWVEFQGKFFYADGYAFKPFSYERVFSDEEE